jgi:hypothetical protein
MSVSIQSPTGVCSNSPLKCCRSLISRRARLAKIFLLKTFVTFLIATPSPVWLFVAALHRENGYQHAMPVDSAEVTNRTRRCRMHPVPAPW